MVVLPPGLVQALGSVLEQIADMTVKIKAYDRAIKKLTETEYPETKALIKVYGVGQLTALTYVLTLGSKERFQRSRDVGCYLGLRPRRSQSGERDPQLGITKGGMSISDRCWASAPTISSDGTERTPACETGVCIWPRVEASSPETGLSLP
jgi:transposase